MSGPSSVIILGEDNAHVGSVYRAITREIGVDGGRVRKLPARAGRGDASKYVLDNVQKEANALRRGPASARLIVCLDADAITVEKRREELRDRVSIDGLDDQTRSGSIVYVVPKRNIETWLEFGRCQTVDEETNYKKGRRAPWSSDDIRLVGALLGRKIIPKENPPPSLGLSRCELLEKIRHA